MTDETKPPLAARDLPPGRLALRKVHLLAEIAADARTGRPSRVRLASRRARLLAATAAVAVLALAAGLAVAGTGWLLGAPAPESVVENFGSYRPELCFHPDSNRALLVARDGDVTLYATTNAEGTYCFTAGAPWKPVTRVADGGTCVPPELASAPFVAGIAGAAPGADGGQTFVVWGRVDLPAARTIRFTAPDGRPLSREVGHDGFFVARVETPGSACPGGDWRPTFTAVGAGTDELGRASITLARGSGSGACVLPAYGIADPPVPTR